MVNEVRCGHVYRFNAEYVCDLPKGHGGNHSMRGELVTWMRDEVLDKDDSDEQRREE